MHWVVDRAREFVKRSNTWTLDAGAHIDMKCDSRTDSCIFDRETYKQRNTVERCINRLKQWRGIATRYEKTATICLAGLHIAGIFLWSAR